MTLLPALNCRALDIELGLGYTIDPYYYGFTKETEPKIYNEHVIGRLVISHAFKVSKNTSINVGYEHTSLAFYEEPTGSNHGQDIFFTSIKYRLSK